MTAPGYVPPTRVGWWVKRDVRIGPPAAALTLVGSVPDVSVGQVLNPPAGALTLTGGVPTVSITAAETTTLQPPAGALTLTGAVPTVTVVPNAQHYTDDFNRTDSSTTLGASWTAKNNVLGILTNRAYPVTSGVYSTAAYGSAMATDDQKVVILLGAKAGSFTETINLILGASSGGELAFAEWTNTTVAIYTNPGSWNLASGYVLRDAGNVTSWAEGDYLGFQRVGNVYTCLKNGSAISGASWTDSGDVLPRNSSHRLVGIGGINNSSSYFTYNSFTADDI